MDATDPEPLAEETLAIFRAVEQLGEHDLGVGARDPDREPDHARGAHVIRRSRA